MLKLIKKGNKIEGKKLSEVLAGIAGEGPDLSAGHGYCGVNTCNSCGLCGNDKSFKNSWESWHSSELE